MLVTTFTVVDVGIMLFLVTKIMIKAQHYTDAKCIVVGAAGRQVYC